MIISSNHNNLKIYIVYYNSISIIYDIGIIELNMFITNGLK